MSLLARTTDFFVLRGAETTARAYGEEQRARVRAYDRAARKRWSAAREVSRPAQLGSALALYRTALIASAEAYQAHQGKEGARVQSARDALEILFGTSMGATERDMLADPLDGRAPGLRGREARLAARAADRTMLRATRLYEPRSVSRIRLARVVRGGALLASVAVVALGLLGWARAPKNVLRGKPVTASDTEQGAPENMVNGAIEWGTYGWMSRGGGWLLVDLEGTYPIYRVRIFNRGDTRMERQVPVHIELLDEQKKVKETADCAEQFSQASPCVVPMKGTPARYLRASHGGEMVLSEIEAFDGK